MNQHNILTISEASQLLYVHPNTLRRWSDRGIIRSQRIGMRGDRRFREEDITFLSSQLKVNGFNPKKVKVSRDYNER